MAQVTMYYKVTCPYCTRAEKILKEHQVTDLEKISIDTNREARAEMIERSNGRTTVPQIFINGQHIGGCDDLQALEREGKLAELLA
ncbi:Glutaredoxin-3 [Oligella urethralis]|uniref:glutaredoxin 3 n=1 Tax=Oligella urethralis TaxID=90245 RepID=UPI000CFE75FE|nr:glutaredoxin 3 [Oligella urethralis]AVL70242.1 glutaredoxin 3 [Oligella urethralis]MDK7178326.1 glutaredoxin 3 [Micrococcus luteus]SUA53377.1 Glutaredoxin-3 [Oligella urethralis]SUA62854.1 Glutaredoxin-3 [Oligella urethralis]